MLYLHKILFPKTLETKSDASHVFVMSSDPEPDEDSIFFTCQCSIVNTDSGYPIRANFFEIQRRMSWISLQKFKFLDCKSLNLSGQIPIMCPKLSVSFIDLCTYLPVNLQELSRQDDLIFLLLYLLQFAYPKHLHELLGPREVCF